MQSNLYLENPDLKAVDGRMLTLKNPALMTREISELANEGSLFSFHITSLRPLNPSNVPDAFETKALQEFETGSKEHLLIEDKPKGAHLRYMAPLLVEQSCLSCHAQQGYSVGHRYGPISQPVARRCQCTHWDWPEHHHSCGTVSWWRRYPDRGHGQIARSNRPRDQDFP